jgi:putative ABC transport system permease protein
VIGNAVEQPGTSPSGQFLLLYRLILRPLVAQPLRAALTLLIVALGVSVVVAIDLAGQAAAGSFHSSIESLSGKADLTITGVGGVREQLLGKLAALPYPLRFSPRIEDFATPNGKGAAVPFIGIDLVGQAQAVGNTSDADFAAPRPIWVGGKLGWAKGVRVRLLINDRLLEFTVAGTLPSAQQSPGEDNTIVADIGLAQFVTGKAGRIDAIDVVLPKNANVAEWIRILRDQLPAGVTVEAAGARTEQNSKMLAAFRWNLRILSYIALVVGAFLIYNTIAVSVVRRRTDIGIVRALGATRLSVLVAFLTEAAVFGLAGGLLGLALGRVLSIGAVKLIGNTVQALYVTSEPAVIRLSSEAVAVGLTIGLGISLIAAVAPALEAARVAPVEAMARARQEFLARVRWRRDLGLGILLGLLGVAAAKMPPIRGQPVFGYVSAMLFVGSAAVLTRIAVAGFSAASTRLLNAALGPEIFLALNSLRASLRRTSVLVAALATAVAMMSSVGIMVGSFRETVAVWMDNQLRADLYLRPAGSSAADRHPVIDPDIADSIERIEGVAAVDRFRVYPITYEGLPASLGGGEINKVQATAATFFLPGENRSAILSELPRGENVIVSEPFAIKHHVAQGDVIQLPLQGAIRRFRVLGIYFDYSTERGFIVMDRKTLLRYLPDRAASNLAVYLKRGVDVAAIRRRIDEAIGSRAIMVFTNAKLRHDALAIFDRTFRITWALEVVAIVVAVIGIAGALLTLVIDRRREFAVLRFLGASGIQIRGLILAEAGLLGLLANAIGVALGTVLSLVLIYVINKQSFGWTIQFHWPILLLLGALTGVYVATLIAGIYPARTAVAMNPIEMIHEE